MSRYLFVGAHMDEECLCFGATLNKVLREDNQVHLLILSQDYDDVGNLSGEYRKSIEALGFMDYDFVSQIGNYPAREFDTKRQSILQLLIDTGNEFKPDFIFTHSVNDIHQSHKVVGEESLRAFKKKNLVTYAGEWNLLQSESNYYIEVSEENMATKIKAMECYKSQQYRQYFDKQFTYSRALLAGAKIGSKYAEPFRIINFKG